MLHMYGLFALDLVVGRGATWEACSGNLEHKEEHVRRATVNGIKTVTYDSQK